MTDTATAFTVYVLGVYALLCQLIWPEVIPVVPEIDPDVYVIVGQFGYHGFHGLIQTG
jgi:hypothetical protein